METMTHTTGGGGVSGRHSAAAKAVRRRTLVDSEAIQAAANAARLRKQVMVTGVQVATEISVIQPKDFDQLNVDEQYQRLRIGEEVNALIGVIRAGGAIPDPIDISERPDGSRWIVDGQQRFWAHQETQMPLRAHIHKVESIAAEVNLFIALNSRRRLSSKAVVKGWPGPTGTFLRRINTSDKSPLKGMIDFTNNTKLPLDSITVVKGVLAATTGTFPQGDTATSLLPRVDSALTAPGRMAWAEAFVQLLAAVFGGKPNQGRVRVLPVIALGRVAFRKYGQAGRPIFPTSCARMRSVNWDTLVPTHARQYLPLIEEKIERLWK